MAQRTVLTALLARLGELGVEDDLARWEVDFLAEGGGLGGAELAVHGAVFPLDGERTAVLDVVEGADDEFEVDLAAAHGLEVPVAARFVEIDVTAEDADGAVTDAPGRVLHVDVENAVAELVDELHVIDALVAEMAGVVVEAEGGMVVQRLEGTLGAGDVEGDLRWVNFERVADAELLILVQDRLEALREVGVTGVDLAGKIRREGIDEVPDAAAGEAVDDAHAETLRGMCGLDEFLGGTLADAFGVAVAIDRRRQDLRVAGVDVVADGLADEVGGDRVALHAGGSEFLALGIAVGLVGFFHFKVVAPAGKLQAVVAEAFALFEHGFE